ncbi:MAG: hypothetical protein ACI351_07880 [Candidatus Avelusimicrobium sp.]|uniref:hypothetical protein n=1 Tax=Candidatus Avelusimicrobium sp. TaxID=3048833 RepID=UPI003F084803
MIKTNKFLGYLAVSVFCLSLTGGSTLSAATPARQLAKGISLYNEDRDGEAMDYFLDVLVNGNKEEVAEANKYVELIHNRMGGIQTPVEVDINFKEGEVKNLDLTADSAVRAAQQQAEAAAAEAAAEAAAAKEAAEAAVLAKENDALAAVEAEQQALTDRIEAQRLAAMQKGEAARQAAFQNAADVNDEMMGEGVVGVTLAEDGLDETAQADDEALQEQTEEELEAARQNETLTSAANESSSSTFMDLTTPEAIEARDLYSKQKIESMTAAAIEKINAVKGVHLYMRDGKPDALDIDPEVLFDRNKFKTSSLSLLDDVYDLLALTQGAAYIILPPGSYTDDVTLSGIRQAMALNSYLINRGISQGKLHYNMGLVDQEPPARFANLNGVAVVFDYEAKLPANMEKNENNVKAPLLSMAVVPLCHAIDRSLGEAYAIDFSVLETLNPVDNWVLQVVQHGRDGNFYVVRQLEGFTSVYHQILWNGRKGIIGPELPCGKYTLVLTATDLKGEKQTLRRRVVVKCSAQKKTSDCKTNSCAAKSSDDLCPKCNYKTSRLWVKPGRTMGAPATEVTRKDTSSSSAVSQTTTTTKTTVTNIIEEVDPNDEAQSSLQETNPYQNAEPMPVNNPYDMPYEDYQN